MRSYQVPDLDKIKINSFFSFRSFDLIHECTDNKFFNGTCFIPMHFSCSFPGFTCQLTRDSNTKLFFSLILFFYHGFTSRNFVLFYLSFYIYNLLERNLENYLYSCSTHTIKKTRKLAKGCKMKNLCVCYQKNQQVPDKKQDPFFLLKISNKKFIYKKIEEMIRFNQFINFNFNLINQLMQIFAPVFLCKKRRIFDAKLSNLDAKITTFGSIFTQLRRQVVKLRRQDHYQKLPGCDPYV